MKTNVAIAGLCAGVTIAAAALGVEIDAPYWLDPAVMPEPDGTTVLLWRFEDGAARDATAGRNNGRATGEVKPAEGRYGGGLRYGGGDQAIILPVLADGHASAPPDPSVPLIVDFWCRVETTPEVSAKSAIVEARTTVENRTGADRAVTVRWRVIGPAGKTVAEGKRRGNVTAGADWIDLHDGLFRLDAAFWERNGGILEMPTGYREMLRSRMRGKIA